METATRPAIDGSGPRGDRRPAAARGWIPWAAVAAGAATPIAAALLSRHTLVWRDTARIFAPLRGLVVDALRGFRLPLWNPHEGGGMPLFAQILHGVLHPVSLAAAALAPRAGLDLFIAVYVVLAGLGAAALARSLGSSPAASVIAGLGFALSGYTLSMSCTLPYLAGAASAPWAVAALRRARGPGGVALAAVAVAVAHLAGDPQWVVVAAALGALLAADAHGRRGVVAAALSAVVGTALAAVQLVPMWSFLQETVRGRLPLPAEERAQWALSAWRLLELVAPGFFQGRPGVSISAPVFEQLGRAGTGFSFFASYTMPFVASVFVGAGTIALAAIGLRASRTERLLGGAAAVLLWIALGRLAGAEQLLHHVPVWGSFRYAEKMVGPLTLCVALLAAQGADRLRSSPLRRMPWMAAGAAVAVAAGAGLLLNGWGDGALRGLGAGDVAPLAGWRLGAGLAHAASALGALALVTAGARRWPRVRTALVPALGALVFAQSLAAAPFALHLGARGVVDEAPLARLAGRSEVVRVGTPLRSTPRLGPGELDETDRSLAMDSRMGVPPLNAAGRIDQIESYTGYPPLRLVLVENAVRWDWRARRRFGLTHVVLRDLVGQGEAVRAEPAIAGGRPLYRDNAFGFTVWEVPHRPWASFADAVAPAAGEDDAFRLLERAAGAGSREVIVEGAAPATPARGRVLAIDRRPERVRLEAEAEGDALLVVNDAWWPGWVAEIDGRGVAVLRADVLVRAIRWPAGRHVLEMRYEPPELRAGAWITTVAAIALGALAAAGWRRRRAGRREG